MAIAIWFVPVPAGTHAPRLASLRHIHRRHRIGPGRSFSAPHLNDAGGGRGGSHRHAVTRAGVRRLRQRERAAGSDRVPRRPGDRQIGPRTAHQPIHGESIRPLAARHRLQHRAHGCADRSSVSEQHGARRRPLPRRAVGRAGIRLAPRRSAGTAARRISHVLRHGEPRGLVGALDDGDLGEPDRHPDRAALRDRHRVRQVAPHGIGAGADCDRGDPPSSSPESSRPASATRPTHPPLRAPRSRRWDRSPATNGSPRWPSC